MNFSGIEDNNSKDVRRETIRERAPKFQKKNIAEEQSKLFPPLNNPNGPFLTYEYDIPRPIIKNYTVNMGNPLTTNSLEQVNMILQDVLLPSLTTLKFSAVRSREAIYQVVRNLIIGGVDGREIPFASRTTNSLMTQLKLLENAANPLRSQDHELYGSNPFDVVIVKCGYPIRYQPTGQVSLAKENISINLRVYKLDKAEYAYSTLSFYSEIELNPWRETLYYQIVKQEILGQMMSPHFPMLYGYVLSRSPINFDSYNRNRKNDVKYTNYLRYKTDRYTKRIEDNKNSFGTDFTARKCIGNVCGGGVLLMDASTRMLLVKNTSTLAYDILGGMLDVGSSLEDAVSQIVNKRLKYKYIISPESLGGVFLSIPLSAVVNYRVYLVKVDTLPDDIPNSIIVQFDKIQPENSLFTDFTRRILTEARLQTPPWSDTIFITSQPTRSLKDVTTTRQYINPQPKISASTFQAGEITGESLATPSGVSLTLVTESPTHNFYQWCSRQYDVSLNNVRSMMRLGIYQDYVWKNILFQIIQGAATMVKAGIGIKNMTLKDSVFVKDLPQLSNQFWLYNIDGIDYYVPHVGYLIIFDIGGVESDDFSSKVINKVWGDKDVEKNVIDSLKKMLSPTAFSTVALPSGVNAPSSKILDKLGAIHTELDVDNPNSISDVFIKCMFEFFHPRVGSNLTEQEIRSLDVHAPRYSDLKKGSMVCFTESYTKRIWVLIKDKPTRGQSVSIVYVTDDNRLIVKKVSIGVLRTYQGSRGIEIFQKSLTTFQYDTCIEQYKL